MSSRARWVTWILGPVLVLAMAAAACGGDEDGGGTTGPTGTTGPAATGPTGATGPAGETTMTIQNFAFDPSTLSLTAGEEVTLTITNNDQAPHTFTLDDGSVDQDVAAGETATVTFAAPSESVDFHCEIHPNMTGTVEVT